MSQINNLAYHVLKSYHPTTSQSRIT